MPNITREQFERWNAKAQGGFVFDIRQYAIWGEKTLRRIVGLQNGDKLEFRLLFQPENVTKRNEYGVRYTLETGRHIPTMHVSRWQPGNTEGVWTSHGLGKYITLGEAVPKKQYELLCKLSGTVEALVQEQVAQTNAQRKEAAAV